jgi:diacylglycerol kinase family enzyme
MAKYATLSEADEQPSDGKFEVVILPHTAKWRVLLTALRATTRGLGEQPSVSSYEFTTLRPLPYQLDREVKSIPSKDRVRVDSAPSALPVLG